MWLILDCAIKNKLYQDCCYYESAHQIFIKIIRTLKHDQVHQNINPQHTWVWAICPMYLTQLAQDTPKKVHPTRLVWVPEVFKVVPWLLMTVHNTYCGCSYLCGIEYRGPRLGMSGVVPGTMAGTLGFLATGTDFHSPVFSLPSPQPSASLSASGSDWLPAK